ncbi:hypothetical protein TNCV_4910101 [Trichonephila clavipes]|nr:hypothetical protein TNCV_4910101 [Trichonephila clavipes]
MTRGKWYPHDFFCGITNTARKSAHQQRCGPHTAGGRNVEHQQIPRASPEFPLLRRQSSQPRSRRGLRTQESSYGPQRKKYGQETSSERARQFTGPPRLIHRPGYAVSNALR